MIFVFYFFAAVLIWLSFKSFTGGIKYLRYFREEFAKSPSQFTPFVSVIAPCKGVDDGFQQNLTALFDQDYPAYEIIFVVDDENDPAAKAIDAGVSTASGSDRGLPSSRIVIAEAATTSSQKVENLREAALHASPDSQAFVFVDSDARPSKNWLRSLVAPLTDPTVGAASGYRWFISNQPTFASEMVSAWNASIASALGPNRKSNFCWGGSTAIARETFQRLNIRERWTGVVSDDFVLADVVKEAGLDIVFVPQALTASFHTSTLRECSSSLTVK